ncbi:tripartite tricarboxylate transporter permease [Pigmentiphaga litoralis]|uniref:tripartite tricarboxylate transporter permease n=1 Tax=Pigmentiphaga litoralis TaxID=516702 RepID=UPI003B436DEE
MTDVFGGIAMGMGAALDPVNLLYCFCGVLLGTLVGVLPGLGPVATVAMLMPFSLTLEPTSSIIMLAGIYYGAQYGGSTTAILVNIPGEASSVVTAIDGYKMAQQGRAGAALGIAAIGSFFAGCVSTMVIAVCSPMLAQVALTFRAQEYFSLMVLGVVTAVVLAHGSLLNALCMVVLGLLLGLVGTDVNSGVERFTLGGVPELADGISFVAVTMGLFGIAEVAANLAHPEHRTLRVDKVGRILPTRHELAMSVGAILRGTSLGSVLGVLPGGGALLASFSAYSLEKKVARTPTHFGDGDIRGVAAPESANNAGAQTSFIPLLTLGIPGGPVMAVILGALMVQGITPGPQVMTERPELFWGLTASMWVGNLMLVVLNLPLIGLWIRLLKVPYRALFPAILVFCCIGGYAVSTSTFEVWSLALFAVLGYGFKKLDCEPAPLVLGFVLGPLIEEHFRRSMRLSDGDPTVFLTMPLSLAFLVGAAGLMVMVLVPQIGAVRQAAMQEA